MWASSLRLLSYSRTDLMNEHTGSVHVLAAALGSSRDLRGTVQVARPPPYPLYPPLLSRLLLGWLVKSLSISGREHVCVSVGAPRAHAN